MGRHLLRRASLSGIAALTLAVASPLFSEEEAAATVDLSVDWAGQTLTLSVGAPVETDGVNLPAAAHAARQGIERRLSDLFRHAIVGLPINSFETVGERLDNDPRLGATLMKMARSGEMLPLRRSTDLRRITMEYRYRLYPDIAAPYIGHTIPSPIRRSIGWIASDNFTGIVIYAADPLPVHGEAQPQRLRPVLLPEIFDEDLEPVIRPDMMDPQALRIVGPVGYSTSLDPDSWQERVGLNPLPIVAIGLFGRHYSDPIISREDTRRILGRAHNRDLLRSGRIVIIHQ